MSKNVSGYKATGIQLSLTQTDLPSVAKTPTPQEQEFLNLSKNKRRCMANKVLLC